MRIALTGNPNSGKTTMYNELTGRSEQTGNWAGVTVDSSGSSVKKVYSGDVDIVAIDLPGAYSMSPFTSEESVTRDYVINEHPDVIINIVDATNLSRSLFFTTQLLELGIPVVVALNKSDINEKNHTVIDKAQLSELLGCPVVETVSLHHDGLKELISVAVKVCGGEQVARYRQHEEAYVSKETAEAADRKRFEFVNDVVAKVEVRQVLAKNRNTGDKIDEFLTHPVLGILAFAVVMFLVFYISQSTVGTWIADILTGWIDSFKEFVGGKMSGASPLLYALLVDGIIGGVGAVVGFLPLVMVMYFLIALLEDCGYMSRATVVLDPIFKKVGLSGKSVIPLVLGTGCGIPAVMSCRTIKNERERRTSAMLATFMPCGAKLPVIALFAGAFFRDAIWVGPLMYFAGVLIILLWALIVKGITGARYKKSYFIIELPDYKIPELKLAVSSMLERGKAYIIKAGTVILVCNTVVQIMQSFTWKLNVIAEGAENTSILASLAGPVAVLLVPIVGYKAWQLAAAAITGMIAKENVVGTLATVYAVTKFIDAEELTLVGGADEVATIFAMTKVAALAYLMFNLFSPPCFAALGAMRSELNSRKWFWGAVGLQLGTGYTVAFLVYQLGTLITEGTLGAGFIGGLIAVAVFVSIVTVLYIRGSRSKQ